MTNDRKLDAARARAQTDTAVPGINEAGGMAMTPAQAERLKALSEAAGEEFDGSLNEADAAVRIQQLQDRIA